MKLLKLLALGAALSIQGAALQAQDEEPARTPPPGFQVVPLGDGPWDLPTEKGPVHVEIISAELERPWGMAFLPGGDMLVTERPGRLRVIRAGKLDPAPIEGLPKIYALGIAGLKGIALHPDFAENRLLYLAYSKPHPDAAPGEEIKSASTLAVLRAKWDGGPSLSEVEDIWVADAWYGTAPLPEKCCGQGPAFGSYGGRVVFGADGYLYISSGDRNYGEMVQDLANHYGKIVRIADDGSIPPGNPFYGTQGRHSDIWSSGHRNPTGMTVHPQNGQLWSSEFGPRGGDEINHILRGHNYGWMDVTQGHHYDDTPAKGVKNVEGMTDPVLVWEAPSVNPGNLSFYTADKFPGWHGDLLVARMNKSLLRASFDEAGKPIHEEILLTELKQRLRDVQVGPDGLIYILTDENDGALLRVEPGQQGPD